MSKLVFPTWFFKNQVQMDRVHVSFNFGFSFSRFVIRFKWSLQKIFSFSKVGSESSLPGFPVNRANFTVGFKMLKSFDNSDGLINISSNREIIYIEVSDDTFAINDELSPEDTVYRLNSNFRFISYSKCFNCRWISKLLSNFGWLITFFYLDGADSIKTDLRICNFWTGKFISSSL